MQDEKVFACADVTSKKLQFYFKLSVCLVILSVLCNGLFAFLVYSNLKKKIYSTYFKQNEIIEQIFNIKIDNNGTVLRKTPDGK